MESRPPRSTLDVREGLCHHMEHRRGIAPAEAERHARAVRIYEAVRERDEGRPFAVDIDLVATLVEYYDAASAARAQGRQDLVDLYLRDIRVCSSLIVSMEMNHILDDPASPLVVAILNWMSSSAASAAPEATRPT